MPRRSLPKYALHKASGQARVRIDGRDIYLGRHGSPESHQRYQEVLADWQQSRQQPHRDLTIGQLAVLYHAHAQRYYRKHGGPTGHVHMVRIGLKYLNREYRDTRAVEFGPKMLTRLRQKLIDAEYSRKYINDLIGVIKRMFRWATAEELVPVVIHQALTSVGVLTKGRSGARETPPVQPVPIKHVEAIRPYVRDTVWTMIEIQRHTGMRPGEVLIMRGCDLDRSSDVWEYRPSSHKTQHFNQSRIVLIGPQAQEVLAKRLPTNPGAYLFPSPRRPDRPYRRDSYTTAVARACRQAGVPTWSPNQLRHTFATKARQEFGIEAARVTLGHASAVTSEIYAERRLPLSLRAAPFEATGSLAQLQPRHQRPRRLSKREQTVYAYHCEIERTFNWLFTILRRLQVQIQSHRRNARRSQPTCTGIRCRDRPRAA